MDFELQGLADTFEAWTITTGDREDSGYRNEELGLCVSDDDDEDPGIDMIICEKFLFFRGRNLIGMKLSELVAFVDVMPDFDMLDYFDLYDDEDGQFVLNFDDLGIQVWAGHTNRTVKTITVGQIYDDDDNIVIWSPKS